MRRPLNIFILLAVFIWPLPSLAAVEPVLEIDTGGHKAKIHEIVFSPDGRYLLSASEDKTVRVWDVQTGEVVRVIRAESGDGPEGMLYAADLSPGGGLIASGGFLPGTGEAMFAVRLTDLKSNEIKGLLKGHTNAVLDLSFSPDGRQLVSASADKTARIWDVRAGTAERVLAGHEDLVYDAAFSPDGARVVTASDDHTLRLWSVESGALISTLTGHTDKVRAVAFTPDGRYILSGGWDRTIRLWDGRDGSFIKVLASQRADVDSLSVSPDGSVVVTGHGCCDPDAPGNVFAIPSGEKRTSFAGHDNAVFSTAVSPGGKIGASGGGDNFKIYLWDIRSGKVLKEFAGRGRAVQGVGFAKDGRSIAWGKKEYRAADVFHSPPLEQSFNLMEGGSFHLSMGSELGGGAEYARAIKSAGAFTIRTPGDTVHPTLQILKDSTMTHEITRGPASGHDHRSITLTPDATAVISGGSGGVLASYNPDTGKKISDFIGHTGDILGVAVSPDGRYLVSGADDQTVRLWEVDSGRALLAVFQGTDREWVAWTPAGYYMSSFKGDDYIGWRINRGEDRSALYYQASRFAKQFYSPLFVEKYLEGGGDDVNKAIRMANKGQPRKKRLKKVEVSDIRKLVPPAAFFQTPADRNVTVAEDRIRVVAGARSVSNEPIKDITILLNGRKLDAGVMTRAVKEVEDTRARIDVTLPLTQKSNRITVIASNAHSSSEPEIIHVNVQRGAPSAARPEENRFRPDIYVMAIGVSEYANKDFNLNSAHKDAIAVARYFDGQELLYNKVHTRLLVNEEATQDNILDGLDWLMKEATQKDTTLIFAAAHGLKDGRGNYYLLPHDGDPEKLRRTGIKWFDFEDVLTGLPSKVILMVDTCYSGSVTGKRRSISDMTDALRDLASAGSGVVVMTASTGKEESQERPEWGHGAFTKAVMDGLTGGADMNKDRIIDIKELDFYVTYKVKELTGGAQHPTTEIPKTLPNFPLAVWR